MTTVTEHLAAVAARPRLRGWLHVWAFVVSVVAGIVLVSVAGATRGAEAALATSVYALTVMLLFGTSAHLPPGAVVDERAGTRCWPGSTTR